MSGYQKWKEISIRTSILEHKISTNFHNNETPKQGFHCICLWVKLIESTSQMGKNYYPQLLLEGCKHIVKKKNMSKYIEDDLIKVEDDSIHIEVDKFLLMILIKRFLMEKLLMYKDFVMSAFFFLCACIHGFWHIFLIRSFIEF